jgi:hypothetical protein
VSSRNDAFSSDPESSSVLKSLGYSEEEIGGTPGEATPDDLRTSLRQLSANHTAQVQREHQPATPPNPRFEKQVSTPSSPDYWQGRKDEAFARKANQNQAPSSRKRAAEPAPATHQLLHAAKQIAKTLGSGGKSKGAGKALGGVTKAQRGRRR